MPAYFLEGLEAVKTGTTNLFEWRVAAVQAIALGYPETSAWIASNVEVYTQGIFTGFDVED